ncbi:MAG: glycosyltransferase [Saprospiraceae bacterium]|nr:glycosyltransferase [Saprospiraceae bacterium]
MLKISIITPVYNSGKTLDDTLKSVASQDYPAIEHIIVDGLSADNSLEIAAGYPHVSRVISEKDKGLYDAINKGIKAATGNYIGILNADDFFPENNIISQVAAKLEQSATDVLYGDIAFISINNIRRITRLYTARQWHPAMFIKGYMPPHPSCYIKKSCYEQLGLYKTDYKIAADYELLIRFIHTNQLKTAYLPLTIVYMRPGGISTRNISSRIVLNQEIVRACAENGLKTSMPRLMMKYLNKSMEYIQPLFKSNL